MLQSSLGAIGAASASLLANLVPTLFQVFAFDLNVPVSTFICAAVSDSTGAFGDSAADAGTTTVTFFVTSNGSVADTTVANALITDYNSGMLSNHIVAAGLPAPATSNGVTTPGNNNNNNNNNNNSGGGSSGLSNGAIAGIVIGSVFGCIILCLLCLAVVLCSRSSAYKNDGTVTRDAALQPTTYQVPVNNQVSETELASKQANSAMMTNGHTTAIEPQTNTVAPASTAAAVQSQPPSEYVSPDITTSDHSISPANEVL